MSNRSTRTKREKTVIATAIYKDLTKHAQLTILPPPKVLVNFRPHNNYAGEYGFDWIRMGDTGRPGDVWYRDIIGSYSAGSFVQDTNEYLRLRSEFQMLAHPTKPNDRYVVPVLTLLPGKKATFSLKVEVAADADQVTFRYDKTLFRLNQEEVPHKTEGEETLPDYLEIECLKEFGTNQYIEVLADNTFAGKLKVLANDEAHRYKADVVFVKVKTDLIGSGRSGKVVSNLTGEAAFLEKYLNQALTTSNVVTLELDLRADATLNSTYKVLLPDDTIAIKHQGSIHTYLETAFAAAHPGYSSYFKVFFFEEKGYYHAGRGLYQGLNGVADGIPSKSVILYKTHNSSTTTHELLHAMGASHSFSNSGHFTFKKGETENIMDYSHQTAFGSKNRISTWQWQWRTIWPNLTHA